MVNPQPHSQVAGRRQGSVLPRRTSRERTRAAWESPSPKKRSRRSSSPVTGRVVEVGKSAKARKNQASSTQRSGRLIPNKKAGYTARSKATGRKTARKNVSGSVVKTSRSASASTRASRSSVKRNTTRSRPQSRNAAGKKSQVAKSKRVRVKKPGGGYYLRKRPTKSRKSARRTRAR